MGACSSKKKKPVAAAAAPAGSDEPSPSGETPLEALMRRGVTTIPNLPPITTENRGIERRLTSAPVRAVPVKFTSELADRRSMSLWKKSALAMTAFGGASSSSTSTGVGSGKNAAAKFRRNDSRIAGAMEKQRDLERANSDESVKGHAAGVALLESRLRSMRLRTERMGDDGNCQFRSLSFNLFGSQDHHQAVRDACVDHISQRADEYAIFFEDDAEFRAYASEMRKPRTWGDELTLRACADAFRSPIHVVQSTEDNWYLLYEPAEGRGEKSKRLYVSYISPVHYNSIVPAE